MKRDVRVDDQRCPKNHRCPAINACPQDAISQDRSGTPIIDKEKCTNCGICIILNRHRIL
jgi:Fe-S-cluster-containing hydrogenase component 2